MEDWEYGDCTVESKNKIIQIGKNENIVIISVKIENYNAESVAATDFLLAKYDNSAAKEVEKTYKAGSKWRCYIPKDSSDTVPYADANLQNKFVLLRFIKEDAENLISGSISSNRISRVFCWLSIFWFGIAISSFIHYQFFSIKMTQI